MMGATLVLVRYCLLLPVYSFSSTPLQMPLLHFILLVISTLLIGAGGYVVNDILDTGLDELNKPEMNLVDHGIPQNQAWNLYYALNIAGIGLGLLVSYLAGKTELGILFLVVATSLYYYSLKYKALSY